MGLDEEFARPEFNLFDTDRKFIFTSGYVSAPNAEAIEEVWIAAKKLNIPVIHLGPKNVAGMHAYSDEIGSNYPSFHNEISDRHLCYLYRSSIYVSGLRHIEGFELPALEGLSCGARPILFDLPCYRKWFTNRGIYVKESHGEELINQLVEIFSRKPLEVAQSCRDEVIRKFSWKAICEGFWTSFVNGIGGGR